MIGGAGGLLLMRGSGACVGHLLHWSRAMLALLWLALWPCWEEYASNFGIGSCVGGRRGCNGYEELPIDLIETILEA